MPPPASPPASPIPTLASPPEPDTSSLADPNADSPAKLDADGSNKPDSSSTGGFRSDVAETLEYEMIDRLESDNAVEPLLKVLGGSDDVAEATAPEVVSKPEPDLVGATESDGLIRLESNTADRLESNVTDELEVENTGYAVALPTDPIAGIVVFGEHCRPINRMSPPCDPSTIESDNAGYAVSTSTSANPTVKVPFFREPSVHSDHPSVIGDLSAIDSDDAGYAVSVSTDPPLAMPVVSEDRGEATRSCIAIGRPGQSTGSISQ